MEVLSAIWQGLVDGTHREPWTLAAWAFMLGFIAGQKILRWMQSGDRKLKGHENRIIHLASEVLGQAAHQYPDGTVIYYEGEVDEVKMAVRTGKILLRTPDGPLNA